MLLGLRRLSKTLDQRFWGETLFLVASFVKMDSKFSFTLCELHFFVYVYLAVSVLGSMQRIAVSAIMRYTISRKSKGAMEAEA